jgi:hypothetical protein
MQLGIGRDGCDVESSRPDSNAIQEPEGDERVGMEGPATGTTTTLAVRFCSTQERGSPSMSISFSAFITTLSI